MQQSKGWKWEVGIGGGRSVKDLYNIDTQGQVAVHMCGFNGIWRSNYFRGEPIEKADVEVRVGKLKNGKQQLRMRSQEK